MSTGAVQPTPGTSNTATSFRENKKKKLKNRSKSNTELEMFSWPIAQRDEIEGGRLKKKKKREREREEGIKRKSERHGRWS